MSEKKHSPLRVEVHCWKDGVPQYPVSPYDITRFVAACSWTHSIQAPWTDINLQLAVPFRYIRNVLPGRPVTYGAWHPGGNEASNETTLDPSIGYVPEPGFWVVIYQTPPKGVERAVAVGRVHDISFGLATAGGSGGVVTTPISLRAESILSFLRRSSIQVCAFANVAQETSKEGAAQSVGLGTSDRTGVWGREGFAYSLESWTNALDSILKTVLPNMELGVLFDQLWKEIVRIWLPPSLGGGEIGDVVPIVYNETLADTFAPMRAGQVPLVPGGGVAPPSDAVLARGQSLIQMFFSLFGADPLCTELFCSLEYSPKKTTSLGTALKGTQPVIVYRLRPWFIAPPSQNTNQAYTESSYKGEVAPQSNLERVGWTTKSAGQLGPRTGEDWYWWRGNDIEQIRFSYSDDMRVNLAYGVARALGGADTLTYGANSIPIVPSNTAVDRHGLRTYTMNWPFTQSGGSATLTDYNNAVSELAWIYGGDGQRWANGHFSGRFRPWVMQGQWFVANMLDSVLTGYIESVSHEVAVNQSTGLHTCRTSVQFSRGTLRHQDSPEWQYRPETAYTNAPGSPASLLNEGNPGSDEGYRDLAARKRQAAALAAAKAAAKASSWYDISTIILHSAKGPMLPGVVNRPKGREIRHIVVHYTNSASTASMLRVFNRRRDNSHTGTHYSVDPEGIVIEWADPSLYYTNNAPGFNTTSIGIDIIGTPSQIKNMSVKQQKSFAALVGYLRGRFPEIDLSVAPQRAPVYNEAKKSYEGAGGTTPEPYTEKQARDNKWGILRHRDVTKTNCPGEAPLEKMAAASLAVGWLVKRVQLTDEQEAQIK